MKLKDITESCGRWSTPFGTMDANATVAERRGDMPLSEPAGLSA